MLKEYAEYKETPALWIDKIPSSWESKKIRELYTERRVKVSDKDYEPLSVCKAGIVPQLEDAVKTDNGDNRRLVKKGDFVINSRSDRKGSSGVSQYDGSVSLICITLKPITNENQSFMHYLLRSVPFTEEYYRNGHGLVADLWTTRYDEMQNIFLPIPPISEQNAIVKYLDYKTKQIDEFISAKEKEIESLQELKKSLVADAVTKGVSGEELVDSGIEWLPKVPKSWTVHTLRHLLKAFSEKNHSEMQLLSVTRELGVIVRDVEDTESNHNFIPDDLSNYKMVKKGQFVINKMKAWQGSYGVSDFDGIVSPAYFIFDLDFENKKFFHLAIRSRKYADFFARYSDGIRIGQWDLSMLDMKNIPFFVPPIKEQEKIVKYCKDKVRNIDTLISSIQKQVTLVKELRTKLIADAVTGKIDVRDVEIPA